MHPTCQPCTPYIHRWGHVTDEYRPHIFVGDVAPPLNIWGGSKSNRTAHIVVVETYIFVDLGTDEYIGTDEWTTVSYSGGGGVTRGWRQPCCATSWGGACWWRACACWTARPCVPWRTLCAGSSSFTLPLPGWCAPPWWWCCCCFLCRMRPLLALLRFPDQVMYLLS
jgi:hypothetical protein